MYFIQKIIFDKTYIGTGVGLIRSLYKKYRGMEHFFFLEEKKTYTVLKQLGENNLQGP